MYIQTHTHIYKCCNVCSNALWNIYFIAYSEQWFQIRINRYDGYLWKTLFIPINNSYEWKQKELKSWIVVHEGDGNSRIFHHLLHLLIVFYSPYCSIVSIWEKNNSLQVVRAAEGRKEKADLLEDYGIFFLFFYQMKRQHGRWILKNRLFSHEMPELQRDKVNRWQKKRWSMS